jgi:trk system potassium uptake protein TrkA
VAHGLVVPEAIDYFELSKDCSLVEVPAPPDWTGKTLSELALRKRFGVTLIAIRRRNGDGTAETTLISPPADERVAAGDVLAVLGACDRIAEFDATRR